MSVVLPELAVLPERRSRSVFQLKADDGQPGRFEAVVAVFDNVDSYGDRILFGAFTESLAQRGYPPIVWTHRWEEPPIGSTAEAEEARGIKLLDGRTVDGLRLLFDLLIDDNARAREVNAAMRATGGDGKQALREFSFAYFTKEALWRDEPDEDGAWRDLVKLDIIEAGPTLLGANPETGLVAMLSALARKAGGSRPDVGIALLEAAHALAGTKAGAVLSAANRTRVESAIEALQEVLADADGEDGKSKSKARSEAEPDLEQERGALELLAAFPR